MANPIYILNQTEILLNFNLQFYVIKCTYISQVHHNAPKIQITHMQRLKYITYRNVDIANINTLGVNANVFAVNNDFGAETDVNIQSFPNIA